MTKVEKAIDALSCALVNMHGFSRYTPEDVDKLEKAGWDALEALKEREPRVIDIREIYTAKKLDVWIEDKGDNIAHPLMLIETEMTNKSQTAFFYPMLVRLIKAYGKTWRCWTARPTEEQRDATPWDELPKEGNKE